VSQLASFLDRLHTDFHRTEFLSSDPLEFAHRYADPHDQEAVALLAAVLAYGNVKQIRRSVADALARMERISSSPSEFVRGLENPQALIEARKAFKGWVHRFNQGSDLVQLFVLLARSWKEHGSLGAHFVSHLDPKHNDISVALANTITDWRKWTPPKVRASTFSYLLTSPEEGSCCKRWCMFLRWMGRKDSLDLGLWIKDGALSHTLPKGRFLRSDQLVIPLDTHTGRISQYLGLTPRKSLNWEAALEVTRSLRNASLEDPTRYDFALARLGILDLCQRRYRRDICEKCQLRPVCRFAKSKGSFSPASSSTRS
jgi:uncharacterized protein (TIGR02757 family)